MPAQSSVFVDTSAWLALASPAEPQHALAKQFAATASGLVTSNFVIDEAITLALKRYGHKLAVQLGWTLWEGSRARIFYISKTDQREAWAFFQQYDDKAFSFTDCTSFVLMRRLGLTQAFTFDADFEQTGLFLCVPR
jgi:predicted nucleic acid-binding protein